MIFRVEAQADSDYEEKQKQKEEEEKKAREAKFEDENKITAEEAERLKKEELKKQEAAMRENARVRQTNKIDLDKQFEKRQIAAASGKSISEIKDEDLQGMSKAAKGIVLEKLAEEGLAD